MSKVITLNGDIYVTLFADRDVVEFSTAVYLAENDDPIIEETKSFNSVLDDFIENGSIPGGTLRPEYRDELLAGLKSMKFLIKEKMKKVKQMPLWVNPNK